MREHPILETVKYNFGGVHIMFKRAKTTAWAAGLIFALSGFLAGGAWAGISATKHNLSTSHSAAGQTIYGDQSEICIFCHTPHAALKNDNIPLWNKKLSEVGNYGMYTSPTFNGSTTIAEVGIGVNNLVSATATNLCLSCHDGTVAINNFSNPSNLEAIPVMTGTTLGMLPATSTTNLGNDLKNDHPVNFTYDTTLVNADTASNGGVAGLTLPGSLVGVKLYDFKVQCASCHDPHTSVQGAFLRVTMTGSALCFACHTK
jgi:predicted CXXCH cytochrome family protein